MFKIFSIFLCFQLLTGNLFGNELAKIPFLWGHYEEHKAENKNLTLGEFLSLHYNNPEHHEKDHEKHHHLPLQHSHQVTALLVFDFQNFIYPFFYEKTNSVGHFSPTKISPMTTPLYLQAEVINRLLRPPNV
jgi:hypothetical protein